MVTRSYSVLHLSKWLFKHLFIDHLKYFTYSVLRLVTLENSPCLTPELLRIFQNMSALLGKIQEQNVAFNIKASFPLHNWHLFKDSGAITDVQQPFTVSCETLKLFVLLWVAFIAVLGQFYFKSLTGITWGHVFFLSSNYFCIPSAVYIHLSNRYAFLTEIVTVWPKA